MTVRIIAALVLPGAVAAAGAGRAHRPGRRRIDPAYARLLVAYLDGYRPADWPA